MTYLFISDLHLSPEHPRLIRGFLALLQKYHNQQTQLYILGDWFNAWIGDDYTAPWLTEIVDALKDFTAHQNKVYFLAGNRDFALGQAFLSQFNAILLHDITTIQIENLKIRLEHGDLLCTDDVSYQRFRKVIRNPILLRLLKASPLAFRQTLADTFRRKSKQSHQVKSYTLMDAHPDAVAHALADVDCLIHGHTHRPSHDQFEQKQRFVLGDWRDSEAKILEIQVQPTPRFHMYTWHY